MKTLSNTRRQLPAKSMNPTPASLQIFWVSGPTYGAPKTPYCGSRLRSDCKDLLDCSARDSRLAAGFHFDQEFPGRSVGGNINRDVDPAVELARLLCGGAKAEERYFAQNLVQARRNLRLSGWLVFMFHEISRFHRSVKGSFPVKLYFGS